MSLCHGLAIPLDRLIVIPGHTSTTLVHDRQVVLGNRLALLGRFAKPLDGLAVVPGDTATVRI